MGNKKRTSEEMVREFHVALDHPIADTPGLIPANRLMLRGSLITEEVMELLCAMCGFHGKKERAFKMEMRHMWERMFLDRNDADLIEVADGCADSHVVISGTAIEFGIPEDKVYAVVHASNMAKQGGSKRADGKTLKPEGWQPPDVKGVLTKAGWDG